MSDRSERLTVRMSPNERAELWRLAQEFGDTPSGTLRRGLHELSELYAAASHEIVLEGCGCDDRVERRPMSTR
jgi:hypothetical protein